MRYVVFIAIAMLAGCISNPQQAANMDSMQLCRIIAAPLQSDTSKAYAWQEIKARGENCQNEFAQLQMQGQAVTNTLNNYLLYQQAITPAYQPTPVNCVWQQFPNGAWQQICH